MSSIMCQISRPVPMSPSEIAVVRIIATVMVRLRRSPVATSESTKLTRMVSLVLDSGERSATDAVDAARLVAGDDPAVELDDATAHGVDDVVVVRCHDDRGAGAVDPLEQQHDPLAGLRVEVAGGLVGQQHQRAVDERTGDGDPLLLAPGELVRQ